MKLKTIIMLVIITGLIVSIVFAARSCASLSKAKADYAEYRRTVETENELMSNRVDGLNAAIAQKDEAIGQLERKVTQYVEKNSTLRAELTALQNAEPVQPELEKEPLVISLRSQVSKLTEMFTLATDTITTQSQEIDLLRGKAALLEEVAGEWKGAYERERQLRVQAEGLFKIYEHRLKMNRFWKTTAVVATGVAASLLLLK